MDQWSYIINGALSVLRVSPNTATKLSPFFLLYNRHPILLIGIRYDLVELYKVDNKYYDLDMFQSVLSSALLIKETTHDRAITSISVFQVIWKLYHSQEIP